MGLAQVHAALLRQKRRSGGKQLEQGAGINQTNVTCRNESVNCHQMPLSSLQLPFPHSSNKEVKNSPPPPAPPPPSSLWQHKKMGISCCVVAGNYEREQEGVSHHK